MFLFLRLLSGMLDASYGGLDSTQFFVERPAANVTAREGEDVLLKCRVGNLQGKVQWTRNGFAMGEICLLPDLFFFMDSSEFA